MTAFLKATVVGGGIAGLTAAASLLRAGWDVTVVERAPAFGEVGAGLALTPNGMAALDAIGAGDAVRAVGHPTFTAGAQSRRGRWLLRLPSPDDGSPDGSTGRTTPTTRVWGVHRQRLHAALLAAADGATLVTGAHVVGIRPGEPGGEPASVTWRTGSDQHTETSDLVVAADGIHSTVRTRLFTESHLAYSGRTAWRAVIDDADTPDDGFVVVWGPQTEFGAVRISATQVYWYGYRPNPLGVPFDDELGTAADHFADWPTSVRATIAATAPDRLMRHDVHHLPGGLPSYVRGRVVMVGDAAHAMLPTMGQGANTSLEDGVCVGSIIAGPTAAGADLATALAAFDAARRPRCRRIARRSLTTARFGAHVRGGMPQLLRNTAVRLAPAGLTADAGMEVLRWTPPPPTGMGSASVESLRGLSP